jgi:HAE1 family hydrophobic/amphiphilic exporter-1
MVFLVVIGFGMFSLSRLQLDLYPDISFPTVIMITNYTGANPEDIETLVTRPIEGAVSSVKGVEEVISDSKQGTSLIQLKFDWGKDMEQAETDVRRRLEMVKGLLPTDAEAPIVFAFDPSMQPIVMMMISGPFPLQELRRIADEEIQPRLERLDGIATAESAGGLEREIHVYLDPIRVEAFGLDVNRVVGAVFQENRQDPGGFLEQGTLDFAIQTDGKYQTVAQIGEVVVGSRMGPRGPEPLRLKEVAQIVDGYKESRRVLEVDGQPAVWMMVRKQSGANTVKAAEAVMAELPRIGKMFGDEIEFKIIFNQANYINKSLGNLSSTAMVGILMTLLVLLLFLRNFRSAIIVTAAIPLSVIATFAVMDQAGMTLNVLSMAGLALSVGMLVDNGIVVLENIFRLREKGLNAWDASIEGGRTVGVAVTAATLTTVSVFIPILFVPGIAGVMFRDMAVTICFALLVSLFMALSFVPLVSSRLLGTPRAEMLLQRARQRDSFVRLREWYGGILDSLLGRRWLVMPILVGVIGLTVLIWTALPTEFMLSGDDSFMFITVEAPSGTNVDETADRIRKVAEKVEEVILPEERKMVAIDVGVADGFASIFSKGAHSGFMRVPLVDPEKRTRSKKEIETALRQELRKMPGIKATLSQPFNMTGGAGDIDVEIRGYDLEASRKIGLDLRDRLIALPDTGEVDFSMEDQKPQIRVKYDREKMGTLGLSSSAVGQAVSTAFMGRVAARFADGGDEYDIRVRWDRESRLDAEELRRLPVSTPTGTTVPLGNVADIEVELGPVNITRADQERVTRLAVNLESTYQNAEGKTVRKDLGASIARIEAILSSYSWPEEFSWKIGGSAEDFQTSFKYLGLALLVSILLVYMVMASQFESLRQPFIILFSVPLAGVGAVLMFALTRVAVDMSALIGIIMLVGIVVNNAIVLVDAANQVRDEGFHAREAVAQAARLRLRPVLMTAMTTIMAMMPMALGIGEGSEGWQGLALAVIGGLTSSTFLTLFVIPVMYTLFAGAHRRSASLRIQQATDQAT